MVIAETEGNSPIFSFFSRLATAKTLVLSLYRPNSNMHLFYKTILYIYTLGHKMHLNLLIKTRVFEKYTEAVTIGKWIRRKVCLFIYSETGKAQCVSRQ